MIITIPKTIPKNKITPIKTTSYRVNNKKPHIPYIPHGLTYQQYHIRRRCPYLWLEETSMRDDTKRNLLSHQGLGFEMGATAKTQHQMKC